KPELRRLAGAALLAWPLCSQPVVLLPTREPAKPAPRCLQVQFRRRLHGAQSPVRKHRRQFRRGVRQWRPSVLRCRHPVPGCAFEIMISRLIVAFVRERSSLRDGNTGNFKMRAEEKLRYTYKGSRWKITVEVLAVDTIECIIEREIRGVHLNGNKII